MSLIVFPSGMNVKKYISMREKKRESPIKKHSFVTQ